MWEQVEGGGGLEPGEEITGADWRKLRIEFHAWYFMINSRRMGEARCTNGNHKCIWNFCYKTSDSSGHLGIDWRIILKCTSQFQIHAYSIFHVILLIFKVITICSSLFHVTNLPNGLFYIKYRTCLTCNVTVFTCNRCLNNYDFTATSYYTLDVVSRSFHSFP
jgi:hypothetical protein